MVRSTARALPVPLVLLVLYNQAIAQKTCYCPDGNVCCGIKECCPDPNHLSAIIDEYKANRRVIPPRDSSTDDRYSRFPLNKKPIVPDMDRITWKPIVSKVNRDSNQYIKNMGRIKVHRSNSGASFSLFGVGIAAAVFGGLTLLCCCINCIKYACSKLTP